MRVKGLEMLLKLLFGQEGDVEGLTGIADIPR